MPVGDNIDNGPIQFWFSGQGRFSVNFIAGADYNSYENIFPKFLRSYKLLQFKSRLDGEGEYYFSVSFKDGKRPQDLVNELTRDKSVKLADLITGKDAAEY